MTEEHIKHRIEKLKKELEQYNNKDTLTEYNMYMEGYIEGKIYILKDLLEENQQIHFPIQEPV